MKRAIAAILVTAAVIAAAIVLLPFLVSSESVRQRIVEKAETLTGRQMSFRDAPKVFFNPYLGIEIESVIFDSSERLPDKPPLVEMEKLRGRLAVLPALLGRVEITQYQFVRPRFNLQVLEGGRVSWEFPDGRVWEVLRQAQERRRATETNAKTDLSGIARLPLGTFEIIDGIIAYQNAQTGTRETLTNVNAKISWPNTASAWAINGSSIWRDEPVEFSIRTAQPLLLMAGGTSSAIAEIKSSAFRFSFEGDANLLADLHLSGSASMRAPSMPRLVNFLGGKMEATSAPGELVASGHINGVSRQVQLTEATISVGGNEGRGVLQLARPENGRPQINATLAFETLDFTPYVASFRQDAEISRPDMPGLGLLERFDSDIRLSAANAKFGPLTVGDLAAALSVRNSEFLFDLGNARLYDGTMMGKLSVKKEQDGASLAVQANLSEISLDSALAAQPKSAVRLNGRGDFKIEARSSGSSAKELMQGLRGWATMNAGPGTLAGADLGRLLAQASNGEDAGALTLAGETRFDTLSGDFVFDPATVWVRWVELQGPKLKARLTGRADLASGGLALRVRLDEEIAGAGEATGQPGALVFVGGILASPLVTRDKDAGNGLLAPNGQE